MALKRSKLNEIPQRNKDLAFGFVKECEKENKSIIPSIIKYLCLNYLNQNKDKFDIKHVDKEYIIMYHLQFYTNLRNTCRMFIILKIFDFRILLNLPLDILRLDKLRLDM